MYDGSLKFSYYLEKKNENSATNVTTIKHKYPDYMYKISNKSDGICRNYETSIANQLQIDDRVL